VAGAEIGHGRKLWVKILKYGALSSARRDEFTGRELDGWWIISNGGVPARDYVAKSNQYEKPDMRPAAAGVSAPVTTEMAVKTQMHPQITF
jgi:hypothetical protein